MRKELEFWRNHALIREAKFQELCDKLDKQGKECLGIASVE